MTQIRAAPRGTPTQYTAMIPASPIVIDAPDGNLRVEWRHFLHQLWLRTGGSVATAPGTITGVTAGHGLSGGGTVGTVTLVLQIPVAIGDGGTGATTAAQALLNLGAAPLASPTFTGTVTLPADPTAALQAATKQYVDAHAGAGGTVTSVAMSGGTTGLTYTGSPVTTSGTITTTGTLAVANGGTGAGTAAAALTALGAAPIASPTFTGTVTIPAGASIAGYAPLASPAFTGTPSMPTGSTAVTQAAGNNSTALATTAYADNLNALVWG